MRIKKAAVLGAGVMGAQIAAHLANAGIPCLLLDIAPKELKPEEQKAGLTLESSGVRNRIAQAGLDAAKKAKPAAFYSPEIAALVSIGNFEDDDFSMRCVLAGWRLRIADDVFIHHFGSRTFAANKIDYREAMERNRAYFLEKWRGVIGQQSDLPAKPTASESLVGSSEQSPSSRRARV